MKNEMNIMEQIDFIVEHTELEMADVRTIASLTDEAFLDRLIREIRRGWSPSIADPDDDALDGIVINLEKNGQSKILD